MKLEVGMYVRTKDGDVFILDRIEDNCLIPRYVHIPYIIVEEDVKKTSNNIIDLIEVGDIIKFDITDTDNYADIQGYNCWEVSCAEELNGVKEMIEMESAKLISIITREQIESMQYKVD